MRRAAHGLALLLPLLSSAAQAQEQVPGAEAGFKTPSLSGLRLIEQLGARRRPDRDPPSAPAPVETPPDLNARSGLKPLVPVARWQASQAAPVPDRWRLISNLGLLPDQLLNPYTQNTLKGDKPIRGHDEFLVISAISDTVWEPRQVPIPVAAQAPSNPAASDIFGDSQQNVFVSSAILSLVYLKGDTTFRPPDVELHFTPVFNFNHAQVAENRALRVDPNESRTRRETFIGVQELFADFHLRNVSDRYDFDSVRFGIQPISLDFRGFLFQDLPYAARWFGTRDNNRWQYNLLWARRLEKDTNSGLNAINRRPRDDDVLAANLYRQDWPVLGFTSQALVAYNRNREGDDYFFDRNGFLARPASLGTERGRAYGVTYFGLNGDGHFGRDNLTVSGYLASGREHGSVFRDGRRDILAGFAAAEWSRDYDWIRARVSGLWASGEDNPYDGTANGFDAIFENPIFAGADTSYWIRQAVPLIGGGGVTLSTRNGVLNNLRTSKEHGQSNFTNPGTVLAGIGADFDLLPTLRLSTNFNHLWFADTTVLEVARNQGGIPREIGWDLSAALIWRPFMSQNAVLRLSYAELLPGAGFRALFPDENAYSLLANMVLTY
ncbi:MAG: hypothetical protein Q8Q73_01935 [Stagnimonas sp.]|nr:hypothetical protein [Stagnimonas sp.]